MSLSILARANRSLSDTEAARLIELEIIVQAGELVFTEVGIALLEIDQKKLYRQAYRTFADYMRHKWGKSKSWGYDQIAAARVFQNVHDRGQNGQAFAPPSNVEQARALAKVPKDKQGEVWRAAIELGADRGLTGKTVEEAVKAAGFSVPKSGFDVRGSSASSEYFTPDDPYLVSARWVFDDKIDLDPCSTDKNPTKARRVHTKKSDGLSKRWNAENVYMNPPWAKADGMGAKPWVEKFVHEYRKFFDEGIACLPASIDTQWWQPLAAYTWCGVEGRIQYDGAEGPAQFPTAFVYVGPNARRFIERFGKLGPIYQRVG